MKIIAAGAGSAVGLMSTIATSLFAQTSLTGVVRDSAGQPIASAYVSIEALGRTATADDTGRFTLTGLTAGMRLIRVRRVGYAPFAKLVKIVEGENRLNDVVLERVAFELDTVRTTGKLRPMDLGMLEFEEHRKLGLGFFVTKAKLDSMQGRRVSEALNQVPGLTMVIGASNHSWLASSRIRSINATCVDLEDHGPREGISPPGGNCLCFPKVYLDKQLLTIGGVVPNINRFTPEQLEAIEVYSSAAQVPAEYSGLGTQCGVIIFHSRYKRP